jgi:hypothetical protein
MGMLCLRATSSPNMVREQQRHCQADIPERSLVKNEEIFSLNRSHAHRARLYAPSCAHSNSHDRQKIFAVSSKKDPRSISKDKYKSTFAFSYINQQHNKTQRNAKQYKYKYED